MIQLLIQLVVIVAAARLTGAAFRRMGQPPVVGEMFAGILLGPSLLGYVFPAEHARLFTESSRPALTMIAQAGVILFMFVVGTRVELDVFRRHSVVIASTAAASISVPFVLGIALGQALYPRFAIDTVPEMPFVLFVATALSVTAFPVLARILTDRGLQDTIAGRTALVCAAINDLVAWMLVASVVGVVRVDVQIPFAVHGVFIAFVLGVGAAFITPRLVPLVERIERPASRYLLPVFFALVGLRTDLHLISAESGTLVWCGVIVLVATLGKLGGTWAAAAAAGMKQSDALTLGILMNTRGLMELVVLNIGHEVGLLPTIVFTMMVVMTLATTCMTGPLLRFTHREGVVSK